MTKNQTTTLIIMLLLISGLLSFAGSIFKLQHWANSTELILAGNIFWVISIAVILIAFVTRRKKQDSA